MSFLPLVRLWIWFSVIATVAGWTLSALGELNQRGYTICFCLAAVILWICRGIWGEEWTARCCRWSKLRSRFSRPFPRAFVLLSLLILLGGLLYSPTNHTALTYRIPRVLQWLERGHWFWIHTSNYRMNDRACGIEWLSAPFLLFTHSDRALFLLNFVPFLMLPGLIYSLFTRLGVYPRVAWAWMWLFPTGYTFLLQAGSTANDTFATVYALAALCFACRAWNSRQSRDLCHSLLAAALLTGAKASNLPLLLPWAVILVPLLFWRSAKGGLWIIRGRVPVILGVVVLALLVSFLPTALLNHHFCGDWSGLALERSGMDMKNPFVGAWGNALLFLLDNIVPPFFPAAGWWNQHALQVLPQFLVTPLVANFELSFHWLWELPTEDWVGLGFGLTWLVILGLFAARARIRGKGVWTRQDALPSAVRRVTLLAGWIALLAYSVKSGMATGARLISPYYPVLVASLLAGAAQATIVGRRWWKISSWIVIGLAVPVLVLTPARPLWPAGTILHPLEKLFPQQRLISRALTVYKVYALRGDPLSAVRDLLPKDLKVVGFMGRGDDPDISFWRPFGQRRVEHVLTTDSAAEIRQRGIDYLVAAEFNFGVSGTTFDTWQQQTGARLVASTNVTVRVSEGPQPWYVLRFGK